MKTLKDWVALGGFILGLIVVIGVVMWALLPSPGSMVKQSVYDAYSGICTGEVERVDEATLFSGGPSGPVPTLLLNQDCTAYGSRRGLGKEWNPSSVSEVQLVAIVHSERDIVGGCGGIRYLNLPGRTVVIFEAKTGARAYSFDVMGKYWCEGVPVHQEEYSASAIAAHLEEALTRGKIGVPSSRLFDSADILKDPQGGYTYIRIIAHRFQSGDKLVFSILGCTAERESIRGLRDWGYYYVRPVDEDTLQLLPEVSGDPIEVTNFPANCLASLTKE